MWTQKVDKIFLVNLAKRSDRLQQATEQLVRYNVPFERIEAVENLQDGAEGLRETMQQIFESAVANDWQNILVFEDDLDIVHPEFNEVMEKVVTYLPPNYDIIYLGCQLCTIPTGFYWKHLLKAQNMYATHAALYSLNSIKEILRVGMHSPIDNCFVKTIQKRKQCYAVYPFLVSQIVSKSDIYSDKPFIDWKKDLEVKYAKRISQMKIKPKQ